MNYITFAKIWRFTVVTMPNIVLYDVTPCGSCKNRRFGGSYSLDYLGDKIGEL
jgi:hypothetical protein